MFEYPKFHKEIVNDLLEGKFLLSSDYEKFESLKEHKDFYKEFFKESFDYEFHFRNEFAYLSSEETEEKFSRNFTIFLAILCYELSQRTNSFKEKIENDIFYYQEIEEYLKTPNFEEVGKEIGIENLNSFLKQLAKRNIIEFSDKEQKQNFRFTKAINLFFEFAVELAKEYTKDKERKSLE